MNKFNNNIKKGKQECTINKDNLGKNIFSFSKFINNYAYEIETHKNHKENITEIYKKTYKELKYKWKKETKDIYELCFIDGLTNNKNNFYKDFNKEYKDIYFLNHNKTLDAGMHIHLFLDITKAGLTDNEYFFNKYINKIKIRDLEMLYLSCPFYLKKGFKGFYHRDAFGYSDFSETKKWPRNSKSSMITIKNYGSTTKEIFFSIEFRKGEVKSPELFFYHIALMDIVYNNLQDKLGLELISDKKTIKRLIGGNNSHFNENFTDININNIAPTISKFDKDFYILENNIKIIKKFVKDMNYKKNYKKNIF